jgi:hypothetical protein
MGQTRTRFSVSTVIIRRKWCWLAYIRIAMPVYTCGGLCWLLSPRVLMNAVKSYHQATKHLDSWFG